MSEPLDLSTAAVLPADDNWRKADVSLFASDDMLTWVAPDFSGRWHVESGGDDEIRILVALGNDQVLGLKLSIKDWGPEPPPARLVLELD